VLIWETLQNYWHQKGLATLDHRYLRKAFILDCSKSISKRALVSGTNKAGGLTRQMG
jgi:hypothetical protein